MVECLHVTVRRGCVKVQGHGQQLPAVSRDDLCVKDLDSEHDGHERRMKDSDLGHDGHKQTQSMGTNRVRAQAGTNSSLDSHDQGIKSI